MSGLAQKWEPRYCHDCGPLSPHVENCDYCFGWGRTAHNRVITAGMARGGETWDGTAYSLDHARPCPQCGGSPPDSAVESEAEDE